MQSPEKLMKHERNTICLRLEKIGWLDFARSIAIIMVVCCHVTESVYSFSIDGMNNLDDISRLFRIYFWKVRSAFVFIFKRIPALGKRL